MKRLSSVRATPEQLPIISQNRLGLEIIYGAAGSGKTSTAILRLRSLYHMFIARRQREQSDVPVRVLVLTFNRTLAGYVRALVEEQVTLDATTEVTIDTFGRWAMTMLNWPAVMDQKLATAKLTSLAGNIAGLSADFAVREAEYAMGRFSDATLEAYVVTERTGRGAIPRVDRALRRRILDEIIYPYKSWLAELRQADWNDIALTLGVTDPDARYDVIVIDEAQDFSANQLRAVRAYLADDHAAAFVMDTVQRVYARGFTWAECGYEVRPERVHQLRANHRNTRQIASFAAGILAGIAVDGDGALPNLASATSNGALPILLNGTFREQMAYAIDFLRQNVDLSADSVAFLQPMGGNWFNYTKSALDSAGIQFVDLTRESEWPSGEENVALCTFHSAKGLEFDYVFILGLCNKNTPCDDENIDDQLVVLRRLMAVAVARARVSVTVGYKTGEESVLMNYFQPGTFSEHVL